MVKVNRPGVKNFFRGLKPLVSVLIIVSSLLALVIFKMEERRRGYELLKLSRQERDLLEQKKILSSQFSRLIRPQQIEKSASQSSSLKRAANQQFIQLNHNPLATVREKGLN